MPVHPAPASASPLLPPASSPSSLIPLRRSFFDHLAIFICFHLVYLALPLACVVAPVVLITWPSNDNDPSSSKKLLTLLQLLGLPASVAGTGLGFSDINIVGFVLLFGYLSWFFFTVRSESRLGRPWRAFQDLPLWTWIFRYFPMSIVKTADVSPKQLYIFGLHPHGCLAFARGMFGFGTSAIWERQFPGVDFRVLTATAALRVPLIREMWLWSNCIDASKPVARGALRLGMNLMLYPGGEREQMLTERGRHRLYLKKRLGFIKLALERDSALVPVYVFGETDLFHHSSFLLGARLALMKRFGVAIPFIFGAFGLMPYAVPVTAVVGEPIKSGFGAVEFPNETQIKAFQNRYITALRELFDTYKAAYGAADAVLEIE